MFSKLVFVANDPFSFWGYLQGGEKWAEQPHNSCWQYCQPSVTNFSQICFFSLCFEQANKGNKQNRWTNKQRQQKIKTNKQRKGRRRRKKQWTNRKLNITPADNVVKHVFPTCFQTCFFFHWRKKHRKIQQLSVHFENLETGAQERISDFPRVLKWDRGESCLDTSHIPQIGRNVLTLPGLKNVLPGKSTNFVQQLKFLIINCNAH